MRLSVPIIIGAALLWLFTSSTPAADPEYTFTTYAGPSNVGAGAMDALGTDARFNDPSGVIVTDSGDLFVTDSSNDTVRKITPDGQVRTFAGLSGGSGSADGFVQARFTYPYGIVQDKDGALYVVDHFGCAVRRVDVLGNVSTFAGRLGSSGRENGSRLDARFSGPEGIAIDPSGNFYVTEPWEYRVRKISKDGIVTTLAGSAGYPGSANGTGTAARFNEPSGIAVSTNGNIYVADRANHTIRRITPSGVVSTIAGSAGVAGYRDGSAAEARFKWPAGLAFDAAGDLYIVDNGNLLIRKLSRAGLVSTVAGSPRVNGHADGPATNSLFSYPSGIAVSRKGELFIADRANFCIRRVSTNRMVSTVGGKPREPGAVDGPLASARFRHPGALAIDALTNIYIADTYNHTVRKITPGGAVFTLAGKSQVPGSVNGTGTGARFKYPRGIAVATTGVVYVADTSNHTVRVISPEGVVQTLAGSPGQPGSADGQRSNARFRSPQGIIVDQANRVYVADTGNSTIRRITPEGVVTTLAGLAGSQGNVDGQGPTARFRRPSGLAIDYRGLVYVVDESVSSVRIVDRQGIVATVASWTHGDFDFAGCVAIALDASATMYLAMRYNYAVLYRITWGGTLTSLAGSYEGGNQDGTGGAARFGALSGVAIDSGGRLFAADLGNHSVVVGVPVSCPDIPKIDVEHGPVGLKRTLSAEPKTATAVTWSVTQQPVGSNLTLTNPTSALQVFIVEEPGIYRVQLRATNASGAIGVRTLSFSATNALWLSSPTYINQTFSVGCRTRLGKIYTLEYRDEAGAGGWVPVATTPGTGAKIELSDPEATGTRRMYRVREN